MFTYIFGQITTSQLNLQSFTVWSTQKPGCACYFTSLLNVSITTIFIHSTLPFLLLLFAGSPMRIRNKLIIELACQLEVTVYLLPIEFPFRSFCGARILELYLIKGLRHSSIPLKSVLFHFNFLF